MIKLSTVLLISQSSKEKYSEIITMTKIKSLDFLNLNLTIKLLNIKNLPTKAIKINVMELKKIIF